ncbi:NAD(P)H-dependent oxidoreductase [Micromonospora sp. WMMD1120]|uniref:flavodoxin family protein n=1 Tax=Micromonospora sp. WMMD1120 TaxID=3016106 RepID=UPI002415E9F0|nr:NAD(P)H-dependent oxidoreductase [Micromonospora sp. WMMD1120]MDG4809696.1 NAD(P)H-dependent oxidoreductase [Micromonospora sp. WMMD1120]
MASISALVLNCTLKPSPAPSSSEQLAREVLAELAAQGVEGDLVRVVDHDVRFGVSTDEGDGDAWPTIRAKLLAAQVLVIATPIWLGQPSSVCKMVLERLDAELSETDDEGRLLTYGKVAGVAVVGNEDGAHHTIGQVQQALNEVGFTLAASAATYWVGEALQKVDYRDAGPKPDTTGRTTKALALNTAHLARLLADQPYPPPDTRRAAVSPSREPA